jgi:carboxyl-terminal processing protease
MSSTPRVLTVPEAPSAPAARPRSRSTLPPTLPPRALRTPGATPPPRRRSRLRTWIAAAVAVVAVFGAGVAVGGSSSPPAQGATNGVLDEAAARIAANADRPVDKATLERAAVEGMLKALGDRWSAYYSPSQYNSFSDALEGRYTGVGLWIRQGNDGAMLVSSVQHGSPAGRAGLVSGDELTSIGGIPVARESVNAVAAQLRGPSGSKIAIGIRRATGVLTVTLTRSQVAADDVVVDRLKHAVLMIRISSFSRGVGQQVLAALAADPAAHAGGVVLDLRDDPGGLVDEAVQVAGAFLDGGPVVSYQRRSAGVTPLDAPPHGDTATPLVVLVDGNTASAAEIVTGALQDRGRAVVVGSRTYGKGSVQEPTTLSDGSAIELTVGRYLTPSGRALDGVGIEPDVAIDPTAAPPVAERRALEVLAGLLAELPGGPSTAQSGSQPAGAG